MRTSILVAVAALAACGRPDTIENESSNAEALPRLERNDASPTGGPPARSNGARPAPAPAIGAAIPKAIHGRWGLVPADCTSTRGDAKGLLVVGPDSLKFHESRAIPSGSVQTSANSVAGEFHFTGEGQEWTSYEALEVQDGKLVRTERDPVASFTYVRC